MPVIRIAHDEAEEHTRVERAHRHLAHAGAVERREVRRGVRVAVVQLQRVERGRRAALSYVWRGAGACGHVC